MTYRIRCASIVFASALLLSACGGDQDDTVSGEEASVSEQVSASEVYEPRDVAPKTADKLSEPVKDDGLGLTYTLQEVAGGNYGGTTVTVLVENNNDQPFPPQYLTTSFKYEDYDGDDKLADAEPLEISDPDYVVGLDVPLGAHAKANLSFPYNVAPGNAYEAEFTIGNVTFKGNLTAVN